MIEFEMRGETELIADLGDAPERVTKATKRALNRAITAARTVMARAIARDTGIKVGDVRDRHLRMTEATLRPEVRLAASLKRIPQIQFDAKGPLPSRGQGRGVSFRVGQGRTRLPHAFLARMRSGHVGVFTRKGPGQTKSPRAWSKNLPIRERKAAPIGYFFRKYRSIGIARAQEAFATNLHHELTFQRSLSDAGAD